MKQFLSIIALCAIAVGLIVLLTVDDGSHAITSKQSEAAKLSQQGANQSQHQELARNIVTEFLDDSESLEIKPLPLIESVQQTAVIQAAFFCLITGLRHSNLCLGLSQNRYPVSYTHLTLPTIYSV